MTPCPCCGQTMNAAQMKKAEAYEAKDEDEAPEIEVSIEGDPASVRSLLEKMIPKG